MTACPECSRLASRVEELEEMLRRYEPDPDFSQKELVQWHHIRMHEVVNRAYRVYCDTKTVFPKGLARWMGVNTENDFSKVISEREMRKKLEEQNAYLSSELSKRDKGLETLRERIRKLESGKTVDDGFGNEWPPCEKHDCALQVMRPGDARCPFCENESYYERRISELESGVRKVIAYLKQEDFAASYSYLSPALETADSLLAGAHAEEKP